MTLNELQLALQGREDQSLRWLLHDGASIPVHYHLTEVGFVKKEFIDCGGTIRKQGKCTLQIWVANDTDHRVSARKVLTILEHARPIIPTWDLPVEIEYEHPVLSSFPITEVRYTADGVEILTGLNHTDCLAKDVCGITPSGDCDSSTGCC